MVGDLASDGLERGEPGERGDDRGDLVAGGGADGHAEAGEEGGRGERAEGSSLARTTSPRAGVEMKIWSAWPKRNSPAIPTIARRACLLFGRELAEHVLELDALLGEPLERDARRGGDGADARRAQARDPQPLAACSSRMRPSRRSSSTARAERRPRRRS
jgi:hypothetical protein